LTQVFKSEYGGIVGIDEMEIYDPAVGLYKGRLGCNESPPLTWTTKVFGNPLQ